MSQKLVVFPTDARIEVYGDSFAAWPPTAASSGTLGWPYLFGSRVRSRLFNRAASGLAYFAAVNACNANLATPNERPLLILNGYNDVKVFLTNARGVEHGKSATRQMLANAFLAAGVPASDGSVTKTGTWSNFVNATSKAAMLSGNAQQSATSGDTIAYTFTGDNVVIGVRNSDGIALTYGTVAIDVGGVSQGSYTANDKAYNVTSSGGAVWNAILLSGFGPGSHTVTLTLSASTTFIVDYFGTLRDPAACQPVILADIQHDNTGTVGRNDAMDAMSAALRAMVDSDFAAYKAAGKIAYAATNAFYTLPAGVSGDNVHPNDLGHDEIFRAFERVLRNP